LKGLLLTFLMVLACAASGQESLQDVLQRGYVRHWVVLEPVAVSQGLASAAVGETDPLEGVEAFAPAGGPSALRPKAGQIVNTTAGRKKWLSMTAASPLLDLEPLTEASEGVVLAAFYVAVAARSDAYLELQSPVGARVYTNGVLGRRLQPAPLSLAGEDRFIVTFSAGTNLVVIEAPLVALERLAGASDSTPQALRAGALAGRPAIAAANGRALSLRIRPVGWLGELAYVPQLEPTGTFSGSQLDPRQDYALTFFNPKRADAQSVRVSAKAATMGEAFSVVVPPVPGETHVQVIVPLSVAGRAEGDALSVDVRLEAGDALAQFIGNVVVAARPEPGVVYVLTGDMFVPDQATRRQMDAVGHVDTFRNQMSVLERQEEYGFFLGAVEDWQPPYDALPQLRERLRRAVAEGRCGSHAGFTVPDERVVCGETLARNLLYGHAFAQSMLGSPSRSYYAWDTPGIAFQSPQLFNSAALLGALTNVSAPGMHPLALQLAPADSATLVRRKQPVTGLDDAGALRQNALLQRRALLEQGGPADMAVLQSNRIPPTFALETAGDLAASLPAVRLHGTADAYFEEVALRQRRTADWPPMTGHYLNAVNALDLQRNPCLVDAFSRAESLVQTAERLATLAALVGARYPGDVLDATWRTLLWCSRGDRLLTPDDERLSDDVRSALQQTVGDAGDVARAAARYLAGQADVYSTAPSTEEGVQALVVFNPSGRVRSDVCETEFGAESQRAFQIVDGEGQAVPFELLRVVQAEGRISAARVRFVASSVPAMGYATYYITPAQALPKPSMQQGAQIENEFLRVLVDPAQGGAIVSLQDKRTGAECAAGLLDEVIAMSIPGAGTVRASGFPARVEVKRMEAAQRLTITTPFLGGNVVRELTLYAGVPRLDCSVAFEDVTAGGRPLAVALAAAGEDRVPVYGERFGAVVGTNDTDALHPFLRWFALASGDYFRYGEDGMLPLAPALIVHGEGTGLRDAALLLQRALVNRGVPALALPDSLPVVTQTWNDSTLLPNVADYLHEAGLGLQILLGDAASNLQTRLALADSEHEAPHDRMVLVPPAKKGDVPLLIVAGSDAWVAEQSDKMATAIAADGSYALPPQPHLESADAGRVQGGLAVLSQSSRAAGVDADGRMVMVLDAGSADREEAAECVFRYALYPFAGMWHEADVAQAAHEYTEPLLAIATDLHVGPLPPRQSFLEVQDAAFVVTAFKPEGVGQGARRGPALDPRNGVVLRGYFAKGEDSEAAVKFWEPIRSANEANVVEIAGEKARFEGTMLLMRGRPFEVVTRVIRLANTGPRGAEEPLQPDAAQPVFAQYWRQGGGVAPRGNLPLTLSLNGGVDVGGGEVTLTIANNLLDDAQEGVVRLQPSEGWTVSPDRVDFALEPDTWREVVLVALPGGVSAEPFALYAVSGDSDHEIATVLATESLPLEITASARGPEVHVAIQNRAALPAVGVAELIVPPSYWGGWIPAPVAHVAARQAAVRVAPFGTQRLAFRFSGGNAPAEAMVRIAAAGQVAYVSLQPEQETK
jgi:hypothetical protein